MRAKFQLKARKVTSRTMAKCVRQALASGLPSPIELIFERVPQWLMAALQISVTDVIGGNGGGGEARETRAGRRCLTAPPPPPQKKKKCWPNATPAPLKKPQRSP